MVNATDLKSVGLNNLVGSNPTTSTNNHQKENAYNSNFSFKIFLPKELEMTTEELAERDNVISSRLSYVDRDTGEVVTANINNIPDIDDVVSSGTWDVRKVALDDVVNEVIIILDIMPMSEGEYGNKWFLALCADPAGDADDPNTYFSVPFGGTVAVDKLARAGGYSTPDLRRIENRPKRLPIKAKIVQVKSKDKGKNPYTDLVSPNA